MKKDLKSKSTIKNPNEEITSPPKPSNSINDDEMLLSIRALHRNRLI